MRRHHICLGDTTTTGGVVVSATSNFTILGRPAAVEGDLVECRACKSTGVITCAGPRHSESYGGHRSALEDDLCACRCPHPPRLVPSQRSSFQTLDGISAGMTPAPTGRETMSDAQELCASGTGDDPPWIGFRLDEAASCEGISCRVVFDDRSHAYAACMTGNRMRLHGVAARHAVRVDYLLDQTDAAPSLTAVLLERITT